MKKLVSFITLLALLVSGCSQEEMLRNGTSASGEGRTFTTSFEKIESRTYLEEGRFSRWTEGDHISLFDGNTLNSQYLFAGDTGDSGGTFFRLSKPEGTGSSLAANYAVYPYDKDMTISADGVIILNLPSIQHYAENSYGVGDNFMVAVTEDVEDTFLRFKNVGGCFKLQLYGDDVTVKSITLKGNNGEKIAGKATITAAYGVAPVVTMADDATASITLDCGEKGVKIGSSVEEATTFWFVVPPTTFEKGVTVHVTDMNDNVFNQSTDKQVSVVRNTVKPMASVKAVCKPKESLKEVLIKLYQSTNGDNWRRKDNWCSDLPITQWYGIVNNIGNEYTINLNGNNLTGKIGANFPDDVKISLSVNDNQLSSLDVSGSTSLIALSCSANQLTTLNASGCTALTELSCYANRLTSLNISGCTSLWRLWCHNNLLTSMSILGYISLSELFCNNNQLTYLSVSGCTALTRLDCSNNQLITLDVSGCNALSRLNCSNNKLMGVITSWFSQLYTFNYDIRYRYWQEYVNGVWVTKYEDRGYGWWYSGEPEKGKHTPN